MESAVLTGTQHTSKCCCSPSSSSNPSLRRRYHLKTADRRRCPSHAPSVLDNWDIRPMLTRTTRVLTTPLRGMLPESRPTMENGNAELANGRREAHDARARGHAHQSGDAGPVRCTQPVCRALDETDDRQPRRRHGGGPDTGQSGARRRECPAPAATDRPASSGRPPTLDPTEPLLPRRARKQSVLLALCAPDCPARDRVTLASPGLAPLLEGAVALCAPQYRAYHQKRSP